MLLCHQAQHRSKQPPLRLSLGHILTQHCFYFPQKFHPLAICYQKFLYYLGFQNQFAHLRLPRFKLEEEVEWQLKLEVAHLNLGFSLAQLHPTSQPFHLISGSSLLAMKSLDLLARFLKMAWIQCDNQIHIVFARSIECQFTLRDPLNLTTLLELASAEFHFHLRHSQSDDSLRLSFSCLSHRLCHLLRQFCILARYQHYQRALQLNQHLALGSIEILLCLCFSQIANGQVCVHMKDSLVDRYNLAENFHRTLPSLTYCYSLRRLIHFKTQSSLLLNVFFSRSS